MESDRMLWYGTLYETDRVRQDQILRGLKTIERIEPIELEQAGKDYLMLRATDGALIARTQSPERYSGIGIFSNPVDLEIIAFARRNNAYKPLRFASDAKTKTSGTLIKVPLINEDHPDFYVLVPQSESSLPQSELSLDQILRQSEYDGRVDCNSVRQAFNTVYR